MAVNNIEEAKTKIEEWMKGRFPQKDAPVSEPNNFQYNSETANGIGFSVIQPKGHPDFVVVVAAIAIDPYQLKKLESIDPKNRDDLLWDLKKELLFWPPHFKFDNPIIPQSIQFHTEISFDELTIGRLHDALNQITRCMLWIAWSLGREFGVPSEKVE
jgi:hypothetical protein